MATDSFINGLAWLAAAAGQATEQPAQPAAEAAATVTADTARGFSLNPYPISESTVAPMVDFAFDFVHGVTIIFFVGIIVFMLYFAVKFRRKTPTQKALSQKSHNTWLEMSWTIPPLFVVFYMFYLGFSGYMALADPPTNAYTVEVTAQKWTWSFRHPNGRVDPGVLHVPAGEPVTLILRSNDVIHSLFIPVFRVKKDVVPGRVTYLWFEAINATPNADPQLPEDLDGIVKSLLTEREVARRAQPKKAKSQEKPSGEDEKPSGDEDKKPSASNEQESKANEKSSKAQQQEEVENDTRPVDQVVQEKLAKMSHEDKVGIVREHLYHSGKDYGHHLFCTEFCGTDHSNMLARVVVHERGWRPAAIDLSTRTPIERGEAYFSMFGCVGCHQLNPGGPKLVGPSFGQGIFGKQEQMIDGSSVTVDEEYLFESIRSPARKIVAGHAVGQMPPQDHVSDEQIGDIIEYIKTLGNAEQK